MIKLSTIIQTIEEFAPKKYQESYDNSGLQYGDPNQEIKQVLIALDVTEELIEEAIETESNLIVSHHPLFFREIKNISPETALGRIITKAIQHEIAIYSCHTNLDTIQNGVNQKICEKLSIRHPEVLEPKQDVLKKLVTFAPKDHADKVRNAIFEAGAGSIGNYDMCSFNTPGKGTFRGLEDTNPFVGQKGKLHVEDEIRIETIFPASFKTQIITALLSNHPYEEVAYDVYPLDNASAGLGIGMVGELDQPINLTDFFDKIKEIFKIPCIRYAPNLSPRIKRVAVCGGSGSFLLRQAIQKKADIFLTSDIKYHQFFETENNIIFADIGHFESEQFTKEIIYNLLMEKFPKFAVRFSKI